MNLMLDIEHLILAKNCKSIIFRMHVIFVYFVRGGFRMKIKYMRKVDTKQIRESAAVSDCTKISCIPKLGSRAQDTKIECAYEIFWIYSTTMRRNS